MDFKRNIKKTLWNRIREIRIEKWFSQERLAQRAKLHRTFVSDIERWESNTTLESIEKLSKALGIEPVELFKWKVIKG